MEVIELVYLIGSLVFSLFLTYILKNDIDIKLVLTFFSILLILGIVFFILANYFIILPIFTLGIVFYLLIKGGRYSDI